MISNFEKSKRLKGGTIIMKQNDKRCLEGNLVHRILAFLNDNSAKNNIECDISEYILNNLELVQHMGIEELAESCYTSSATISRYIKKIGYKNYATFKWEVEGFIDFRDQKLIDDDITVDNLITEYLQINLDLISELKAKIDIENLKAVANQLLEANRVYFYGIDYSQIVTQDAQLKLINNDIVTYTFVQRKKIKESVNLIKPGDIAFFISASGESEYLAEISELIDPNITKITLTQYADSTLGKVADRLILIPKAPTSFAVCAMSSRIVQLLIIDILYLLIRDSFKKEG